MAPISRMAAPATKTHQELNPAPFSFQLTSSNQARPSAIIWPQIWTAAASGGDRTSISSLTQSVLP